MIHPDNAKVSDLDDDTENWDDVHDQIDAWILKYGEDDDGDDTD